MNNGKIFSTYALVKMHNNETRRIILSNSPHFIQSLETAQKEMVHQLI